MIEKLGRKKYNIYAFDVESHNDPESIKKKETSIWLASFINDESKIDDESSYFYTIEEWLDKLEELSTPKRKNGEKKKPIKNVAVFIWNLSFEWSFILPKLLERGFKFEEKITSESEYSFNSTSTKSCSSVWRVSLKFSKKSGYIELRDLAKMFNSSLGKVASSFGLETQKGEIDYRANRISYEDENGVKIYYGEDGAKARYEPTKEEKEYCFKDTRIIIEILMKMQEKNDKEFWSSTSIASYSMKKMLKDGYPRATKPYKKYREDYPELDEDETNFLREGVEGGITYSPSLFQFKDINCKILHIDAHQMHPTQMYTKYFPYGKGEYFVGKPTKNIHHINCCRIKVSYSHVKLHSIIKLIGLDIVENKIITVWDFEIATMKKCYEELEIEYIDGYCYKAKPLPFRKYVANNYRKRKIAKANDDKFNILYYKLLNNSAYGKFLEKPHNSVFENYVDDKNIINSKVYPKDELNACVNSKYTYLPVGSCIPAYSRVCLIELALKFGWRNICYFDTDSIFCIYNEETKKIWETVDQTDFLGGWGLEEIADKAQFTAPKRYKLKVGDETIIKMAGINLENEISYDELNITSSSWKVKRAFRCKGGTIIDFQDKKIDVQDKYKQIYINNVVNNKSNVI